MAYLRKLLSWFKCPSLTLDLNTNDFILSLLSRKDQPLLIEDTGRLTHAKTNGNILDSAMINGTVEWKKGRNVYSLPIQAPVVLLSSQPSSLTCSPEVMILEILNTGFDKANWLKLADTVGDNKDYLTALCGFATNYPEKLQTALEKGEKVARKLDDGRLTEKCLRGLEILIGTLNFLHIYYSTVSVCPTVLTIPDKEFIKRIFDLLIQTSEKADRTSLPDQFIEIVKLFIQNNTLHVRYKKSCPSDMTNIVFYDANYLYFTSDAFFTVCQSMLQSRPVILKALTEAGLIGGTRTNQTTVQTRITVWDKSKKSQVVSVYALPRESFETFGDPLFIDEEDIHDEP